MISTLSHLQDEENEGVKYIWSPLKAEEFSPFELM